MTCDAIRVTRVNGPRNSSRLCSRYACIRSLAHSLARCIAPMWRHAYRSHGATALNRAVTRILTGPMRSTRGSLNACNSIMPSRATQSETEGLDGIKRRIKSFTWDTVNRKASLECRGKISPESYVYCISYCFYLYIFLKLF